MYIHIYTYTPTVAQALDDGMYIHVYTYTPMCKCTDTVARALDDGMYGVYVWGGYGQHDRLTYRSLLQNIVSFIGLFCKRDI